MRGRNRAVQRRETRHEGKREAAEGGAGGEAAPPFAAADALAEVDDDIQLGRTLDPTTQRAAIEQAQRTRRCERSRAAPESVAFRQIFQNAPFLP
jgi:hypothetical protein